MYAMQPITYTYGSEIQAPYRTIIQPGNIESGVALGPASRLAGECLARHVSQPGMCWGKFSSQNTRAVDQYDPMVSGALETQWALASTPHNTLDPTGNVSNILSYANQQQLQNSSAIENRQQQMEKQAKAAAKDAKKQADKAAKEAKKQADKAAKSAKKASGGVCSKDGSCSSCS